MTRRVLVVEPSATARQRIERVLASDGYEVHLAADGREALRQIDRARPDLVLAAPAKVKVGILLPYTGTYASLGNNITDAMIMAIEEAGGTLGGRPVEYVKVDSEADPAKAANNANKLIFGEKVDFLTGPVHSGVAMAMVKIAREEGTITIVSNAGADAVTRQMCAANIFRTSFSNWQTIHALGKVMWEKGHKTAAWISWKYAAGEEMFHGFKEGYEKVGGKIVKELWLPFPNVAGRANGSAPPRRARRPHHHRGCGGSR